MVHKNMLRKALTPVHYTIVR